MVAGTRAHFHIGNMMASNSIQLYEPQTYDHHHHDVMSTGTATGAAQATYFLYEITVPAQPRMSTFYVLEYLRTWVPQVPMLAYIAS